MSVHMNTVLRNLLLGVRTNLITNPSFTTDTSSWTAVASSLASVSGGLSGNALQITNSGAAAGSAYQDIATVVGKVYVVTVPFKKGTGAGGTLYIGTTSNRSAIFTGPLMTGAAWPATGPMDAASPDPTAVFIATATTTRITLENTDTGAGTTSLFDEVMVHRLTQGLRSAMKGHFMTFYTSTQPANADLAANGIRLVTFTLNGDGVTGLDYDDPVAGVITKGTNGGVGESWTGTSVAAGTAGWFRCWVAGDNPDNAATVYPRWDGAIGTSGQEINVSNAGVDNGAIQSIPSVSITFPA